MQLFFEVLLILFYVLSPLGILQLCNKYQFVNKMGPVLIAYLLGILLSMSGLIQGERIIQVQDIIMSVCIPLGIPLLLFSSDFKKSFQLARKTFVSLLAALGAVIVSVVIGYLFFRTENNVELHKVGGLLVGVYTGGTPNLAALKLVLDVKPETYLIVHTYDMLFSTIHLFFLMTIGKKVFEYVLPKFKKQYAESSEISNTKNVNRYTSMFKAEYRMPLLKALAVAILIVLIGGGAMMLVTEKSKMAVFVLFITSLGILASLNRKISAIPKTFDLGMYFILIFSVVVASKLNLNHFTQIDGSIFFYVLFVVFGSLFLHVVFSLFFKVDADTVIVTSAALICSPPFVPVVAGALKNKSIIIPGITVGVIGYAVGNYLGYLISMFLISL